MHKKAMAQGSVRHADHAMRACKTRWQDDPAGAAGCNENPLA
jgi:hypothetical protein